jgi:hypothetical protein
VWIFFDMRHDLKEMLEEGGYLYFCLLGMVGYLAWRLDVSSSRRRATSPETIAPAAMMSVTLIVALSYLAITFFAGRVYCYIPVFKGGGDYTTESTATFQFDTRSTNSLPPNLLANGCQSKPVFIIQQNSSDFFLAITNGTNNPITWRHLGRSNKPNDIFVIKRDAVVSYEFGQSH